MTAATRSVSEQASIMLDVLDELHPGARQALLHDAMSVIGNWNDVNVRIVDDAYSTGQCSVAGGYMEDDAPPTLIIADSASTRRHGFTVLHEYGHHLQRTSSALWSAFTGQADGGFAFEEAACDRFAALMLMPAERLTVADSSGVTADDVVRWFGESRASRSALCVHAASRLTAPGHVVLLDAQGGVCFAAAHSLPPPRRGSDQSRVALVGQALSSTAGRATGKLRWVYRDGIFGDELYAQIAALDGFSIVVTMLNSAPWAGFAPPPAQIGPQGRWLHCANAACEHEWRSFDKPCTRCAVPACPQCERCACPLRIEEVQCTSCWQLFPSTYYAVAGGPCRSCMGD